LAPLKDSQLNVYNIKAMRMQEPQTFDFIRFDPNNDCNVHCVYCHNHRSKEVIDTEVFLAFLEKNVISVNHFQMGCIMEPTLDPRLCDLMTMIAQSPARPSQSFVLQTNGILLHRHDYSRIRDGGVTHLSVSIDAADPLTHKALRGGTSLPKVFTNLASFYQSCPSIDIVFITTVTKLNIAVIDNLIAYGLELGVKKFVLREVFYYSDSEIVDHARMPNLILEENAFTRLKESITAKFTSQATFEFADAPFLNRVTDKMKTDSFRS
jgi:MoaA/NifB/PqqE/SkfB family radical SAM enzyme